MHDRSVLDVEVVSELQDIMGQDFQMLVESFQRDGEQRLAALDQAFAQGDANTLRSQAHSFKGSSSNLGTTYVAGLCMDLETLLLAPWGDTGWLGGVRNTTFSIELMLPRSVTPCCKKQ